MIRWQTRLRSNRGFTLIELVVVMIIITILAGAVTLQVTNYTKNARRARAVQDIKTLETAIDLYEADSGYPPTAEQGLMALIRKPGTAPVPRNWNGPYLKNRTTVPKDPWGNEYIYVFPGRLIPTGYDLMSYGADGSPGGQDEYSADITNLDED